MAVLGVSLSGAAPMLLCVEGPDLTWATPVCAGLAADWVALPNPSHRVRTPSKCRKIRHDPC